ncbi:MAG: hypothetical protein MZV64_52810 [Ignavibacteriales bacterium]|nr:hypothetical protein [Ignavibacteriales bacterium]
MRETDFLNNVKPDGAMMFRTSLPLGSGVLWDFKPAADGQMGRIISLYRDWQISGDTGLAARSSGRRPRRPSTTPGSSGTPTGTA